MRIRDVRDRIFKVKDVRNKVYNFTPEESFQIKEITDLAQELSSEIMDGSTEFSSQITVWRNQEVGNNPMTIIVYKGDSNKFWLQSAEDFCKK